MAINLFERQCDKISSKYSSNSQRGSALPSRQLVKLSIATDGSITSGDSKSIKTRKKNNSKSPYLSGDSAQLVSRITEKKLYSQHKKSKDIVSSFPLAANIYKANSDEFKQKKGVKKVKKSVLTLPNAPTVVPQTCTVSDMNDSEYCNGSDDNRKLKAKKRFVAQNKKTRPRGKDYEFYDRDAPYCSQMNINLDCSSTDMITQFIGDGKTVTGKYHGGKSGQNEEFKAHDVWRVLRNINRFQFRPSPPISEDSMPTPKKKKIKNSKRNNRKDTRVIESCRTSEFTYISSFEVDNKSPRSFSQSSSFDRITVIDKQDEFSKLCKEFEKSITTTKNVKVKNRYPNNLNKNQVKKNVKNNQKMIGCKEQNEVRGLQNKNTTDSNKNRDTKDDNFEHPLFSMNHNSKVVHPQKQYACGLGNRDKSDDVQVLVNRDNEFDYSLCSESTQVGITDTRKDYLGRLPKASSDESGPHVKGITKVILSKGQSLMQSQKNEIIKRKPHLATTMLSATLLPKLTQTEIKRRLANLKFPIVILERDQLTSASIQVMNNNHPHLENLDQPVWLFMQDWFNLPDEMKEKPCGEYNSPRNKNQGIERKNNPRKINDTNGNNQLGIKDKNSLNNELTQNKKKYLKRTVPPNEITKVKSHQQSKKTKPIHQLKDKMLKLLYKNPSSKEIDDQCNITGQKESDSDVFYAPQVKISKVIKKIDVGTETSMTYEFICNGLSRINTVSPRPVTKKTLNTRQSWAKAKWASDFIETVISKIRSGIYFNQESKHLHRTLTNIDLKEASVQTVLCGKNFSAIEQIEKEDPPDAVKDNEIVSYEPKNCLLATLPGFDDSLPALEIKTLNMKEVAVKYCTTDVMVQFDVAILTEPENLLYPIKKSTSLVPLTITESDTNIFKCKTTIINAMLPAEICSLLPKIIKSIIDTNNTPALPAPTFQNDSLLYTISELSHCESSDIFKPASLPVSINISPAVSKLLDGVFSHKERRSIHNIPKLSLNQNRIIISKDWLMDVSVQKLVTLKINPLSFIMPKGGAKHTALQKNDGDSISSINSCTTLDLYREKNSMINTILSIKNNDLGSYCKSKLNIRFKINSFPIPLDVTLDDNKIIVTLNQKLSKDVNTFINGKTQCVRNFKIDSLFNGYLKHSDNAAPLKAIENGNHTDNRKTNRKHIQTICAKTRKRSFVRLYKKCKSMSNISGERCCTSLSKIANLDDFFLALGVGKILTSIFDGLSGKKILSSVIEMKNWITDISQRQAMLVLLLTNKKDTPNLVRFRPILLQGIAVNRITRASELDMEIEVIEREHFNKFSQYDGIPCLTESVENQDNLMEELYWIAKTTASDYQRPFNEASEKLLKSLLEKRKKLNPSYLRVMARYVGLGLLKSPKN